MHYLLDKKMQTAILKTVFWGLSMYHGITDLDLLYKHMTRLDYLALGFLLYTIPAALVGYALQNKPLAVWHRTVFGSIGVAHLVYHDGWKRLLLMALLSTLVTTTDDLACFAYVYLMAVHYHCPHELSLPKNFTIVWEAISVVSTVGVQPWERSHTFFEKALMAVLPSHFLLHLCTLAKQSSAMR